LSWALNPTTLGNKTLVLSSCKLKQVEKADEDMFGNVACFEQTEFLDFLSGSDQQTTAKRGALW
jgi:hypothetical protein